MWEWTKQASHPDFLASTTGWQGAFAVLAMHPAKAVPGTIEVLGSVVRVFVRLNC